ncbi:AMP-dependent synthetase/ligase [Svornostia abyssi]|uniref:Acyl-CoA synthetase n=1 Tax=Svornostia abyssi TaxID=2898438 RepID=A0ABY5PGW9_9ACTN|nr:AMP-dependent synthetase/ligase [Parviterribacteraceae bacterium J379]
MEAGTGTVSTTESTTIAGLAAAAFEKYADRPAVKFKTADGWQEQTFAEVGDIASEIGRGLIDLGIAPGDRVAILSNTRVEWTYVDFAATQAGATVVPIYQTNSPEECEWVLGNAECVAVVCEDTAQLAKVREVQSRLPHLQHIVVMVADGDLGDAISLDDLRARGREHDVSELQARTDAVTPDDIFTIIYTSGTTGPPKGCVLSHGNYRSVIRMCIDTGVYTDEPEVTYLFLPLAHSFALIVQLLSFETGNELAYFGGDTKAIVGELAEVKPTYLPSVPRIFEKIYTLVSANADPELIKKAVGAGLMVKQLEAAGQPIPPELQEGYDRAEERLFKNVRAAFGGNLRHAVTGAAPIQKEILEFFYACGVPVMEGYGMTETATVATAGTLEHFKFGTVGKPLPGVELKIAEDGELLIKGPNIFQGYYKNADASFGTIQDGWLHTGDIGSIDEEGYLSITGRKKDIIITAGGKNLTPANLENDLKSTRWISQAVMHGDRRPYPIMLVTLDEEEIIPWAQQQEGMPTTLAELSVHPTVQEMIQAEVDKANAKYAQVEQVKKFAILPHDLSQETGELTPTLKVKRNVVNEKFAGVIDGLYTG